MVTVADEMAALSRLHGIAAAEERYSLDYDGAYATLPELIEKGYIGDPSQGKLSGYRFEIRVVERGFQATAVPVKYGVTGKRSFYVDESKMVHGADKAGAPASSADPAL